MLLSAVARPGQWATHSPPLSNVRSGHTATQYRLASARPHPPPPGVPGDALLLHAPCPARRVHVSTLRMVKPYFNVPSGHSVWQSPSGACSSPSAQALQRSLLPPPLPLLVLHPPRHAAGQHSKVDGLQPVDPHAAEQFAANNVELSGFAPTRILPFPPTYWCQQQEEASEGNDIIMGW